MHCFLLVSLFLAWLATDTARADTCQPIRLIDQIQMVPANHGATMLVPVTINGVEKFMIFDTGAPVSSVTRALTQELKLSVRQDSRDNTLYDVNGNVSRDVTTIARFKIGQQEVPEAQFRIWPDPDLEKVDPRFAGVLSRDQFHQYDLDIDFSRRVLKLFSSDHCKGETPAWNGAARTVGTIEKRGGRINALATLDGQKLNAIIDSGAVSSFLSADVAKTYFGLTAGSPGMEKFTMLANNPRLPVYQHQFFKLDFNGMTINNPLIAILPSSVDRNASEMGNSLDRTRPRNDGVSISQLIIGMDILKRFHIYIAPREQRMYLSEVPENSPPSK